MIKVDLGYTVASIEDGQWQHDDLQIVALLDSTTPIFGISGADPDSDYALAEAAVAVLGGKILSERPVPDWKPGLIY
jgi:hypothetical protein